MEKEENCESSRKCDADDEEKPLKKARYVWEVKGKGHLRDSSCGPPPEHASSSTSHDRAVEKQGTIICSAEASSKNCCIETFLSKTEDIMDNRDSSDDEDSQMLPLDNSFEEEIPVTLVSAQPKNQEYYLRKWQARQIARGFVDNTINTMLEHWVDRPFDAVNFVEDCENDGQVEDDAILMAIQSHGLQSGFREGLTSGSNCPGSNSNSNSSFNSNLTIAGSSRCGSVKQTSESTLDNFENLQKEQESSIESTISSGSAEMVSSISNPYEEGLGDPMDFLNAAVLVAIQKKGLTY